MISICFRTNLTEADATHANLYRDASLFDNISGQLKLVICATTGKLTVTVLGMRSLPPACRHLFGPIFVSLKVNLLNAEITWRLKEKIHLISTLCLLKFLFLSMA